MSRPVFAPVIAAVALVFVGANLAVQLGAQGGQFYDDLNETAPALSEVEPEPGREQTFSDRSRDLQIDIAGIDRQACGGTHLSNTAQSARFEIGKIENKGKRNRRIRFRLES